MKLRPYQERVVDRLYELDSALPILPMGAGKTACELIAISELTANNVAERALIVAPKRVAQFVWPDECKIWTPELDLVRVQGTPEERRRAMREHQICALNFELLPWAAREKLLDFDMLVIDELTKVKGGGVWSKIIRRMGKRLKIRHGLSGTFATGAAPDELYWQARLIDDGRALGANLTKYRDTYLRKPRPEPWAWTYRDGALEAIAARLAPISIQISAEEYEAQLPPVQTIPIRVQMPSEAFKKYRKLEKDYVLDAAVADNAGILANKLQQFADGFLLSDGAAQWYHDEKLTAYTETLADINAPTMVVYRYIEELEAMQRIAPGPALGQGISERAAEAVYRDWNAGRLPVMYVHPLSAGHGLNLQSGGHNIIWYGLTWSLDEQQQLIRRLQRPGQKSGYVRVYVLCTAGTVDEDIMQAWIDKSDIQTAVIDGIRRRQGEIE